MSPRKYDLGKRAEAAEATRRRIVEATYALHDERGVAATTYRDIAERADVSLATVYRHFPEYGEVVQACGALNVERMPVVDPASLDGVDALVDAVCTLYEWKPGMLAMLRADAGKVPALAPYIAGAELLLDAYVRSALPDLDDGDHAVVLALLDEGVHRSLRRSGLTPPAVRERIAAVIRKATA